MKHIPKPNLYTLVTLFFIFLKLSLHFLTNTNYELHRDELLYFNMGDHLSFGYATVPPLIGFLAFAVKSMFGYSVFGIRLVPALLGAATMLIISKIIKDLGGKILALVIALVSFLLSPGYLLFDSLFTPNVIEQFLWLSIMYLFFRMVYLDNNKLWIWIGILTAFAFLNKYSVLFLVAGLVCGMLAGPERRRLVSPFLLIGIATGVILIMPNIVWQYQHGWPVVFHLHELNKTQMVNMRPVNYFLDLFSLNFASTVVWLFGLLALLFLKQEKKIRFIGVASLLVVLSFLLMKGKGYYSLGLLPFLFAFGAYAMEKYFANRAVWASYAIVITVALFSLLILPFGLPILSLDKYSAYASRIKHLVIYPFYRWEDGKVHNVSQVYSDMTGWEQLTTHVAKAYNQLSENEKKNCIIYAERNYGYAGAVHFYGRKYGLPEAITFLESYVFWAPDTIPDGPLIYINYEMDGTRELYRDITEIGTVIDKHFRENGLKVFLCKSPLVDVQVFYKEKGYERKKYLSQISYSANSLDLELNISQQLTIWPMISNHHLKNSSWIVLRQVAIFFVN